MTTTETTQHRRHCGVCGDDACPITYVCSHCADRLTDINLLLSPNGQLFEDRGDRDGAEITCWCGLNSWQLAPDPEQDTLCSTCSELLTRED